MKELIAKKYVKALVSDLSKDEFNNFTAKLQEIANAFANEKFQNIIVSPNLKNSQKADFILSLVGEADQKFANFIKLLGENKRLDNIEQKLKDSKAKKDDALRRVEEAKANAASLVETARKEAILISERIKEETRQEVANLEKSFQDQKEFEKRRMVKSVVGEILNEIFASDSVKMDQSELINIMLKRVG